VRSIVMLIEGSAPHSALRMLAVEYAAASSRLPIYRWAFFCRMKTDRSATVAFRDVMSSLQPRCYRRVSASLRLGAAVCGNVVVFVVLLDEHEHGARARRRRPIGTGCRITSRRMRWEASVRP
jgi:hypothetical protein